MSVALKRLVGFSAKNRFYRANRDLGRIFKTEFILQYLSEPELRRRIWRGLLKVEQLHAVALAEAKQGLVGLYFFLFNLSQCFTRNDDPTKGGTATLELKRRIDLLA